MREDLKIIGMGLGIGLTVAFLIGLGIVATRTQECKAIGNFMSVEYQYTVWTDCMIKVDNRWVPLRNYRVQ